MTFLSLSISSNRAAITVTVSMTIISTVVTCLSFGISTNGATVAVAVSVSSVSGSFDLLISYFSHIGLLSNGHSRENSQYNQEFHCCSQTVNVDPNVSC